MTARQTLGSYELLEEIGRGAMGLVYRAEQPSLGRQVAVKVLLPHLAQDPEFVERFLREARAAAALEHPGIVTIHDVGEVEGTYYFSMQYLTGQTLEQVIRERGRVPIDQAVAVTGQLADALGYAHRAGIIHRDIKPSNILLDQHRRPVITDFGIAWAASSTRLTRTGSTIGSPEYMPPEQISGKGVDHRSDLYSLGVVLYQMLAGEVPYVGDTALSVAYQHVNDPVRSPREANPEVPEELDAVNRKMMSKQPGERHQSAGELLQDLSSLGLREMATMGLESREMGTQPPPPGFPAGQQPDAKRRSIPLLGILLSMLGLALVGGAYYTLANRMPGSTQQEAGGGGPGVPAVPQAAGEAGVGGQPANQGPPVGPAAGIEPVEGFSATLEVASEPAGAEVWVDGIDTGSLTPAPIELEGKVGQEVMLELRRDGVTVADERFVLGPDAPAQWSAELPPLTEVFTISSRPPGARVLIDGRQLEEPTPATVELEPGTSYQLALQLDGYDATGFTFSLEDLTAEQRQEGSLHFPLVSSAPPGLLVVRAGYPVRIEVGGRGYDAAEGTEIELMAGDHEVRISAPEVFLERTERVTLASEQQRDLVLPPAVAVTVGATPSNCRVEVDGRPVDYVPVNLRLTVGPHEFTFHWDTLGESLRVTEKITLSTKRVFVAAPE